MQLQASSGSKLDEHLRRDAHDGLLARVAPGRARQGAHPVASSTPVSGSRVSGASSRSWACRSSSTCATRCGDEVLDELFDWFREVDERFSTYKDDSEISRLNRGELHIRDCHPDVRWVLARCDELREETGGYFDARYESLLAVDPSGLVKGWSVDRGGELLETPRASRNYSINAGGDIRMRGARAARARLAHRDPAPAAATTASPRWSSRTTSRSRRRAPTSAASTSSTRTPGGRRRAALGDDRGRRPGDRRRLRDRRVRDGRGRRRAGSRRCAAYEALRASSPTSARSRRPGSRLANPERERQRRAQKRATHAPSVEELLGAHDEARVLLVRGGEAGSGA